MSRSRILLIVPLVLAALGLGLSSAQAQDYPGTTVTTVTVPPTTPTTPTTAPPTTDPTTPTTAPPTVPTTAPPTAPPTTVPGTAALVITADGPLLPGATVGIAATGSSIVGGQTYNGTLLSTPVALPLSTAQGNTVGWRVTLPRDWELNAFHRITVVHQPSGVVVGSERFYVDSRGRITAPPRGAGLPRTGSSTDGFVKGGIALLAVGGLTVVAAKRRRSGSAAA